jgi:hypothetical protein
MAGFALIFDPSEPPTAQTPAWVDFLESVITYKCLGKTDRLAVGAYCIAAKLDAPCSLHRGITLDAKTGSWLLAVGTVVDQADIRPDGSLDRLLVDYLERGIEVFARLDGQFALIIYDAREDSVVVVSDPFGMISIYYGQRDNRFYISTSALAIAKAIRSAPSELRTRSFLLYGNLLRGTLWQDVQMLPPATTLQITCEGVKEAIYWSFDVDPAIARLSLDESVDCIIESFSHTLCQSLTREGKFWISLTGGLDSRTLAAMTQQSHLPFKAYCHGPSDSRDVRIATRISQQMGWEHEYFALPDDWGCQCSSWLSRAVGQTDGHLAVVKLSRTIREQAIKAKQLGVSLWGYGGELYRGYYWKQEFWKAGLTSRVDYDRFLDYRVNPLDWSVLRDGTHWKSLLREELKTQYRTIGERQPDWPNTVKLDLIGQGLERPACGTTIAAILGQQRVVLPYDFKENIARVFSVSYRWRTHSRLVRLILERTNPKLAGIETADGGPATPMRLTNMHRFVPYWLDVSEKLLWKLGYKYLGKAMWNKRDAGPAGKAYPVAQWLQETVLQLQDQALLVPDKMHSASLYDKNRLQTLVADSTAWSLAYETLLSRIITLEMALRLVETGF